MAQQSIKPSISLSAVKSIQSELEKQLHGVKGVRSIGIGFDKKRHQPNLKVLIDESADRAALPESIDSLDIEYDLIDDAEFY